MASVGDSRALLLTQRSSQGYWIAAASPPAQDSPASSPFQLAAQLPEAPSDASGGCMADACTCKPAWCAWAQKG